MGILNLAKFLADMAPHCIKETEIKTYFGKLNPIVSSAYPLNIFWLRSKSGDRRVHVAIPVFNRRAIRRGSIDHSRWGNHIPLGRHILSYNTIVGARYQASLCI